MTTKLKFLWVLLALLVGGVNSAWAETTYESYKKTGGTLVNTNNYFTYNGNLSDIDISSSSVTVTTLADGNITIPTALQIQSNTTISFTVSTTATVYVGVYIKDGGENKFQFDSSEKSLSSSSQGAFGVVEITSVTAGTHTISKTSSNDVGIYYIKVVESQSSVTFTWTPSESTGEPGNDLTFSYTAKDANNNDVAGTVSYSTTNCSINGNKIELGYLNGCTATITASFTPTSNTYANPAPVVTNITVGTHGLVTTYKNISVSDMLIDKTNSAGLSAGNDFDRDNVDGIGFDFNSSSGDGVKYNNGNYLLFTNGGSVKIKKTSNAHRIRGVEITYSSDNPVSISFTENVGTRPSILPAGNNVTAILNGNVPKSDVTLAVTDPSNSFSVTNFKVYHNNDDIADKIAPTLAFSTANVDAAVGIRPTAATLSATSPSHFDISSVTYSIDDGGTGLVINSSTGAITSAPNTTGTATVTATFAATTCFAATTATYTITVRAANLSGPNNDTQTYPYTWDFTTDWTSSQTQCTTTYDDWQQFGDNVNYYNQQFPTAYDSYYPIGFGIDKLKGLRFSHAGFMAVDWNYGHLWLYNGNITIPGTTSGQIITVVMEARDDDSQTVTGTNTEETGAVPVAKSIGSQTAYTFHSTGGDVTLAFVKSFSIRSISVTNPVATWDYSAINATMDESRPNKGYITFTSAGTLAAGTITDIPGLTITMPQNMTVRTVGAESGRFSGIALFGSPGQSISFTPTVNGYLSFLGNIYNTTSGNITIAASSYYTTLTEHTMPVLAGQTYTMTAVANYGFDLNSIGFRPAFLVPDKTDADYYVLGASAEQTTKFEATTTTDKSSYPKLITAAQAGTVRFSESTWTAYLYDNNDVELNGYGDNLYVRGRVYAPAPHEDRQLNAYYLLYANVLQLSSNTPTTDATTNDVYLASLSNDKFTFTFNQSLTSFDASKVKVYKDGSTSPMSSGVTVSSSDANLEVTFSTSPTAGETYRIVVEKDAVSHSTAKNAEIIRTFSITSSAEPPISMIYPTGVARVGDPIVLQTNVVGTGTEDDGVTPKQVGIDNSCTVTGTLKAEGETDRIIKANIVANRLVFKPETPLSNNKKYTLYLPASNYNSDIPIASSTDIPSGTTGVVMAKNSAESDSRRVLKHDKSFVFKTATSSGSEPTMTDSSPYNLQKGDISYDNGTIKITFDQAVEITPYTTINATPVNGSEATAHGSTALPGEAATLYIDNSNNSNNRTICFDYSADGLKYDLWTEVVIPAYSIIGTGGKPNTEEIKFRFKMDRNQNSTPVTAATFYPHTWDFNRFGVNTSTITNIEQQISQSGTDGTDKNYLKLQKNVLQSKRQNKYLTYVSHKFNDTDYDQGNDVYIMLGNGDGTGTKYKLLEFEGLRISLVNKTSDRFEIRDLGDYQKANEQDTGSGQLNADGTHKYIFRLNGNTHYVTLSNVPAGKLYMVVNSKLLGINSPNATFEENTAFSGTSHENNTKITNTNGTKKLVVNVSTAGDVSFCVGDFSCEKIGVSTYSKPFKSQFAVGGKTYATDCQPKAIRHDLVNAFTGDNVRAYYVSSTDGSVATATELTETSTTTATSTAGAGTIVVLQSGVSSDTEIPFFKTDVNTAANENTNLLRGTTVDITNFDNSAGNKFFFSNLYKQLNNDKTGFADGTDVNETDADFIQASQMGFYRAMGTVVSANKAWLEIQSSSRKYYVFKFDDEEEPTSIKMAGVKNVTDDGNWYTLQGLRVANPAQGTLYIHNGKKVVFK